MVMRNFIEEAWHCPHCGASGDNIQCTDFTLADIPEQDGLRRIIPTKIWCAVCAKEYPIVVKEKVAFT
jgi:hypothetical protein